MLSWGVFEGSADAGSHWAEVRPAGNVEDGPPQIAWAAAGSHNLETDRRVSHGGLSDVVTVLFHAIACAHVGALTKQGWSREGREGGAMVG
jgi:hypothetical protein